MRAVLTATVALVTGGIIGAAPAGAVTGGHEDTKNEHPNVGLIVFYSPEGRFRCTATLMTPTTLLTAGHCTFDTIENSKTIVTFEQDVAREAPSDLPRAADDPGTGPAAGTSEKGYTQTGPFTDTRGRTWYTGTAHTHPQYSDFTDMDNWNDVGVVVLDTPVPTSSRPSWRRATTWTSTPSRG